MMLSPINACDEPTSPFYVLGGQIYWFLLDMICLRAGKQHLNQREHRNYDTRCSVSICFKGALFCSSPCCHLGAFIVSSIHRGSEGSNMAMPMFANVIEPTNTSMVISYSKMAAIAILEWEKSLKMDGSSM